MVLQLPVLLPVPMTTMPTMMTMVMRRGTLTQMKQAAMTWRGELQTTGASKSDQVGKQRKSKQARRGLGEAKEEKI